MVRSNLNVLISALTRLKLRKGGVSLSCPLCRGAHVTVITRIKNEEGKQEREEYLCRDCDCSWDWTYRHPLFRWRPKIRAPHWIKIDE